MLRNVAALSAAVKTLAVLNEVLSLNAQESHIIAILEYSCPLLNEVLSLNAQEFGTDEPQGIILDVLNEVLSLNAQEW